MKKLLLVIALLLLSPSIASARPHRYRPVPTPTPPPTTQSDYVNKVTFYGWPDNDPAGNGIAYSVIHKNAGGVGTYSDPITFASSPDLYAKGTIIYVPYLQKYTIMEDYCASCINDYKSGIKHIDIWMNSNGNFNNNVIACENKYTKLQNTNIIVNPPNNLTVNSTPLFNTASGLCL
jgi:3D (Asp-Asp-Asp) domain-containing protein